MIVDKVIDPGTLRAANDGFSVGIRLPWYRALPLSTVEVMALRLDGEDMPLDRIRFELDGAAWPLAGLGKLTDRYWFVLDTATLHVSGHGLEPGSSHSIEVMVGVRPPYIEGLRNIGQATQVMVASNG